MGVIWPHHLFWVSSVKYMLEKVVGARDQGPQKPERSCDDDDDDNNDNDGGETVLKS
jgi:hypothetical protein